MTRRIILAVCATVGILLSAGALAPLQGAAATTRTDSAGATTGYDISWPQCSAAYPSDGSFGIVGVTDGRPWSANPCLGSENRWAAAYPATPGLAVPDLYMNTANPAPHSSYYWPVSGARDPALCQVASSTTDPGCAYDYGWHAAASAFATAAAAGAAPTGTWWLDVETGNTWNGDASSNAADIQGSVDYLMSQRVGGVGVYSTASQWEQITGGYTAGSAASYAAAWQPEFASPYGIGRSQSWVAGASPSTAETVCASSFLGTSTLLTQYISGSFDVDHLCTGQAPADYSVTVPSSATSVLGTSVSVAVTLASTDGWSGSVGLRVTAPSAVTAVLGATTLALGADGSATTTLTVRGSSAGSYDVVVAGVPQSGSTTSATRSGGMVLTVSRARRG